LRPLPAPLLLITDRTQSKRPLIETVAAAIEGGCRWVMLREKDLPPDAFLVLAREIAALAERNGATLSINGDIAAAKALKAGLHLPADGSALAARAALRPAALIGKSAHNLEEIEKAQDTGADYVTLSPIFASASKPGYGPALGIEGLRRAAARLPIPVVALAGIDADNAGPCLKAGASAVAIMGGVMRADDPAAEVRALLDALHQGAS
jgi:thiamine-phosphate pyrophosphorylase